MRQNRNSAMRRKNEGGSYLVLGAFVLVALMVTAGLAVDISRKYQLEQKAQDTADAAAKAGVAMMPSLSAMALGCTTYIQQSAGAWYVPRDEDIVCQISADNLSGTVGVFIRGTWDPIIMPAWLVGDNNYEIGRYAIARGVITVNNTDTGDTIGATDFGELALWIGDTSPPGGTCGGDYNAQLSSNNVDIWGMTQINHDVNIGPGPPANSVDFHGDVNVAGTITGDAVAINTSTTTEISQNAPVLEMPQLPVASEINVDLTLDINLPGAAAYYAPGSIVPLVDPVDGIYGNGNDVPIMASNSATPTDPVMVRYTGTVSGHQKWDVTGPNNMRIQAGNNPAYGNGFDLKVVGDLNIPNSIDGMDGMIWTTGTLTLGTNNGEYLTTTAATAVAGKDNPGSLFYTGPGATVAEPSLTLSGNFSQGSFTGLLYVDGGLNVTGNSSNNTQAVVGAVWAGHIDVNCGSDVTGNNWGILGNIDSIEGVPLAPAATTPAASTPIVWLQD